MLRLFLLLVGALLAAVVQMAWGFVFWMLTPIPMTYMLDKLPAEQESQVAHALADAKLRDGHYFSPFPDAELKTGKNPEAQAAFMKKQAEGPLVELIYRKEGVNEQAMGLMYAYGFGHFAACSLLAGFLTLLASAGLRWYVSRVLFVMLLGVFAAGAITLANPIWYHHPWQFSLVSAGFQVVSWSLAALVLGAFVRPPRLQTAMRVAGKTAPLTADQFHPSDRVR